MYALLKNEKNERYYANDEHKNKKNYTNIPYKCQRRPMHILNH